jgi:hypothetical protein
MAAFSASAAAAQAQATAQTQSWLASSLQSAAAPQTWSPMAITAARSLSTSGPWPAPSAPSAPLPLPPLPLAALPALPTLPPTAVKSSSVPVHGSLSVPLSQNYLATPFGALPLPPLPPLPPRLARVVSTAASAAAMAAASAVLSVAANSIGALSRAVSPVPLDAEGYVQSFSPSQVDAYRRFYDEYGFVVIHSVLPEADCSATIDEIWAIIENRTKQTCGVGLRNKRAKAGNAVYREDEKSWQDDDRWLAAVGPVSVREGMVGTGAIFAPRAIQNRYNPLMLGVAQTLLEESDLIVSHDRYGIFRPTAKSGAGSTVGNLHLDMNPWRFAALQNEAKKARSSPKARVFSGSPKGVGGSPKGSGSPRSVTAKTARAARPPRLAAAKARAKVRMDEGLVRLHELQYDDPGDFLEENNLPLRADRPAIQMLINLADNKELDGGLIVVPSFPSQQFLAWTNSHRKSMLNEPYDSKSTAPYTLDDNFIRLDDNDPVRAQAIRVTSRAGSLIVWDKRMVHGSLPNQSNRFRYAQFFLMAPRSAVALDAERAERRRRAVLKGLKCAGVNPKTLPNYAQRLFDLH